VISFRVIPESQRLAVLRDAVARRLVGPGIVVVLKWPGRRYFPISIGDYGQRMDGDACQEGGQRDAS
jgi:hypothetical protein